MDASGEKMGSLSLKEKLKSLCSSNGWCYGVFWRFDQRNPMLLVAEDAYFEKQMGAGVDNMLDKVHMLGEGIVGLAAFTGKDQWIFSDATGEGWKSAGPDGTQDAFQDDSEVQPQFSSGIKTIAVVSVESQGVIELGSTQKIPERLEFLDQLKRLIEGMEPSKINSPSSLNCKSYDLDEWFDSLCGGNITPLLDGYSSELMELAHSSIDLGGFPDFTLDVQEERLSPLCLDASHPINQLQTACHEAQLILPSKHNSHLPHMSLQSASSINMSVSQTPCISTKDNEGSILTSIESQFISEFPLKSHELSTNASTPIYCGKTDQNFQAHPRFSLCYLNSGTHVSRGEHLEKETSVQRCSKEFKPDGLTAERSNPNEVFELLASSPEQCISEMATVMKQNLIESGRNTAESSGLIGDLLLDLPFKQLPNSVQSSITDMNASRKKQQSEIANSAENNPFENFGEEFNCGKAGNCLEDLIRPALSGVSECNSELDVGSRTGPQRGLFSELGLKELFDSINESNSARRASLNDQLSTSKRRKMEHSSVNFNQSHVAKVSETGGSIKMQPVHTPNEEVELLSEKETILKSQRCVWINDSCSANNGIASLSKFKKTEEPAKATRKRARPGESTRPRPRDRQQIQDRIKELKEIIPDGGKCSIDALLDRTIKHMLFLQSVTKYADKLKQADAPKLISQENRLLRKDNNNSEGGGGITWALEVADETAICPIVVEDLNPPGLMLIEMLCDDRGFFLEIADAIKGFGLNVVKGVMESSEHKIWARFIVEAKVRITRAEVLWSLVELLNRMGTSGPDPTNQHSNGIPVLDGYSLQHCLAPSS